MLTTQLPVPIRTGIIGFGLSGRVFHAPLIATNPAFRLEVISTSNPERAAQAAAHHPAADIVDTPEAVLERAAQLDLVVLASPPSAHFQQALAVLDAGTNLVIDKPFVPTVVEAKQLITKAEEAGLMLTVFKNRRWDGDFLTLKRLLASGALGKVHRFESTFERWGGALRDRWQDSTTPNQGGGITYDLGSHLIDQALQLFGPATVDSAELTAVRTAGTSDDDCVISLLHNNGVRSHLTMSRVAGQLGPRFRVLGSESAYSVMGLDNQEDLLKQGQWPGSEEYGVTPETDWGLLGVADSLTPVETDRGAYPSFYSGVAASILDGAPPPVEPREALEVVRIIERAHALSAAVRG
ncbi:MAG: Gfo/Idh/MocA family protein [Rhodoglobus sp.]